jgi:hypothetical protein
MGSKEQTVSNKEFGMTKKIRCHCGATAEVEVKTAIFGVNAVREKTGFQFFFVDEPDCLTLWLCPQCNKIVIEKARELANILGNPCVKLLHLLPKEDVVQCLAKLYPNQEPKPVSAT